MLRVACGQVLEQSWGWVYPRVPKSLRFLVYGWRGIKAVITWPFEMSVALCLEQHNLLQLN